MHALELCVSICGIWSYRERGSLFVFFIVVWIQSFQTIRQRGCVSNDSLIDWLKSLSLFLRLFFLGAVLQPPTVSVMQLETTRRRNAFRHMGGVEMFMLNLLELCWSLLNTKICLLFKFYNFVVAKDFSLASIVGVSLETASGISIRTGKRTNEEKKELLACVQNGNERIWSRLNVLWTKKQKKKKQA